MKPRSLVRLGLATLVALAAATSVAAQAPDRGEDFDVGPPAPKAAPAVPSAPVDLEDVLEPEEENKEETWVPGRKERPVLGLNDVLASPDAGVGSPDAGSGAPPVGAAVSPPDAGVAADEPERTAARGVPLVLAPRDGDRRIDEAWRERQTALASRSFRSAQEAEHRIEELRLDLGYENLFALSAALAREAESLLEVDPPEASRRAYLAASLSPDLPYASWIAARAALSEDFTNLGRAASFVLDAFAATFREPPWRAAAWAELSASLALALLMAGAFVLALGFARHGRYFLHDFHHLFPTGAPQWATTLTALALLALPWAAGLGLFAGALVLALAIWLHASLAERAVAGAFLVLLALAPSLSAPITRAATFQGTTAEIVYWLERGGHEGSGVAAAAEVLAGSSSPSFQALFALGRQARRRGEAEAAVSLLRRAAELRPGSAEALAELGSGLVLLGDLEGAREAYTRAADRAPERAEPLVNLARLHTMRAGQAEAEEASAELGRSQDYARKAISVDHRLGALAAAEPDKHANRFFVSMPLSADELHDLAGDEARAEMTEADVSARVFGPVPQALGLVVALLCIGALAVLGLLSSRIGASQGCPKCGRPICRRCDQDSAAGLCGQCTNVFNQRAAVDPPARAAKEMEILKHQRGWKLVCQVAGVLFTGAGQTLQGRPVTGFLLSVASLWLLLQAAFAVGLVRVPFGGAPPLLRAVPLLALAGLVHALAIRFAFTTLRGSSPKA